MKNTIIILGGGGQLGGAVAEEFRSHGWKVVSPSHAEVDVSDGQQVEIYITKLRPTLVLNATWFPVLLSEANPEVAYRINALGAHASAVSAQKVGAMVVYISTDYVFDGTKQGGFLESDCPNPLNVYGASKLSGEHLTRIGNPLHYIIRTSALFGTHSKPLGNFVLKMKARAEADEPTSVVDDQTTCPTLTTDLASHIYMIIEKKLPWGVYHVTNTGSATWYDFAYKIFQHTGKGALVSKSKTSAEEIVRPRFSVLRSQHAVNHALPELPHWEDALRRYLRSLDNA